MLNMIQIDRIDCEPSQRIALTHRDIPKTEKFCMSGPVKNEKSILLPLRGQDL